ncbi:MAG: GNAT family N-acetyltransferase [Paracoccaceae bacterium]|nr:GNAT family N-acetyltransferase [Paracoccaceae bacterium]MDG2256941.1 GNAT family N-acetyltransferase [Paracoccaceae bacterium]
MNIRQAELDDADAIAEIWNAIIRTSARTFTTAEKTTEGIAADIRDSKEAFIIAEIDGEIIGFATYFSFRSGPGYAFTKEHSVNLDQRAWGKGVGRALMDRLELIAKADGVHSLIAGVSGENPDGVAFHKAIGFEEVAQIPSVGRKFERWMDLILLQKFL